MYKSKKITAMILTLTMLCMLCPIRTLAGTGTDASATETCITSDGAYEYRIDGTETIITKYKGSQSAVSIPDTIEGKKVTSIGSHAFEDCSSLVNITIPNSVTYIYNEAFKGCSSLTNIIIPNGVRSIYMNAFYGCSSLANITIPDSVISIQDSAFHGCSSLTDVTIPNSVTCIDRYAFAYCSSLTNIIIPSSVTSINVGTFSGCSSLTNVSIPNGVTSIGVGAFSGCSSLTDVSIPNGVTSIGEGAFSGCSVLTNVTIPNGVTSIDEYVFRDCRGLANVTIPNGVTSIGAGAFSGCSGLANVTIPNGVTSIGAGAFSGCRGLVNVTIPNGVTSIGAGAFSGCSGLTNITIPNSVISIGYGAFSGCSGLTNITIPNGVISIDDWAFNDCSSLTNVDIPNSVTSIGNYAFEDCSSLTDVSIPNSVISIGGNAFCGCSSLVNVTISNSVTSISGDAFKGCSSLTNVTIPNSVISISYSAFKDCSSLTNVTILNGVTSIYDSAFYGCSSLTNITIPNSIIRIGAYAFDGCSIEDVYFEGSEQQWDKIEIASSGNKFLTNATIHFNGSMPSDNTEVVKVASNNNLTFSVYDGAKSDLVCAPLAGAQIAIDDMGTAQTDEEGIAVIANKVTDEAVVNKKITITKPGYKDYIFYQDIYNKDLTEWIVNPNKISVLMTPLKTGEDAFPYVSTVTLQTGSTTVRNALDTAFVFDSRESIRNASIRINAVWNGKTPKNYRIFSENEKKSYTSTDGTFQFDMLNAFSSGSPIWVELIATDGTGIKQKTKISVKQYSTGSSKKPTLTLAEAETGATLGNDIPLLAGQSIDFKLKGINMSASVSEGKVKIMLGAKKKLADGEVFSDAEWKEWKDACQLQPYDLSLSQWNNLMEAYDVSVTSNATAKAEIYGYLEGTWNNGGDTIVSGVIKLDASMGTGVKGQYFVGGIPVYANVSFTMKGNATGRLGFNWTQICIDKDATELSFTITPTLQAEAGVGVMAVATVGVSGEGSLPIKTKIGEPDAVNVSLKGKMSIKTSVLGFKHSLDLTEKTWQLYPETGTKAAKSAMQLSDFEVADRSYLKSATNWTGGKSTSAKLRSVGRDVNSAECVLEKNVYPDAQLQMVETNQTRMLLWTEDDRTREAVDRSKLVYSVYNEASGWSQPQAVADDGTADYSPTVIADDSHIYVSWQNNGIAYGTDAELADVAKKTKICMAVWDDNNKSFSQTVQMSADQSAAYSPKIALNGDGNPYTVYVTNTAGNPFLTEGTNDLRCAVYDGSTVENKVMVSNVGLLTSFSTKYTNQYELSYTSDADGDYSTQDDRELYTVNNGGTVNISKNSGMDSNVRYVDWNGKTYRFWYATDGIVMADNTGKQTVIYQDETGLLTDDFSVVAGDDSQLAVVWTTADEQGNKQIQGILYDAVSDSYTKMVQLSDIEGDICQPSGIFLSDGSILFAYKKVIDGETDLCTYHCTISTDMAVENAYCDEDDMIPGQKAPVNVEVKNDGLQIVQSFQVDIGGTKTEFSDVLMPGESKIVTASYNVPNTLNYGLVDVTVEVSGDTDASNDTHEMPIGYTDVSVKVTDNNLGNGHIINVEASNDSYVNAQTKLNVYTGSADGTLIKSIDFGTLEKGSVTTVDYLWNKSTEEYSEDVSALYFVLETEGKERYTNNNYDFVAVGKDAEQETEKDVKVESISLSHSSTSIKNGNTIQLSATVKPDNAANKKLKWTSDHPSVATVDSNGLVTAVGVGKSTITAKAQDGSGVEASCVVEVTGGSNNGADNTDGGSSSESGDSSSGGGNSSTGGNGSSGGGNTSTGGNNSNGGGSTSSGGNNTNTGGSSTTPGTGNTSTAGEPTIKVLYYIVNFDKNGGANLSRRKMTLLQDDSMGILPKVERKNYKFLGWYTQPVGGTKVTQKTVLNVSTTLHAHWEKIEKPSKEQITSLNSKKARSVAVKYKKLSGIKGYEIAYSTNKKFTSASTNRVVASSTEKTLKKLKSGKTYYVKVRAYKTDSTGKKIYGAYSEVRSVQVK